MRSSLRYSILCGVLAVVMMASLIAGAKSGPSSAAEAIKNADQQWAQAASAKDVDKVHIVLRP